MRWWVPMVALLSGCSLLLDENNADPDGGGTPIDAGRGDAGLTPLTVCPSNPNLRACFLFNDTPDDGSMFTHPVETAMGLSYVPGIAGTAVHFDADDQLTIAPATTALELTTAITIEAWIRTEVHPPDDNPGEVDRDGIIDKNSDWALFLVENGAIDCNVPNSQDAISGMVPIDVWTHVACTYNMTDGYRLYINGTVVASRQAGGTMSNDNAEVDIGSDAPYTPGDSHFEGDLDNLLIWSVARTRDEICETSGLRCDLDF